MACRGGGEGLTDEVRWMAELNIDRMEISSGERECYWLVALRTAWEAWGQQVQMQQEDSQ